MPDEPNQDQTPNDGAIDLTNPAVQAAISTAVADATAGLKGNRDTILTEKRAEKERADAAQKQLDSLGDYDTIKAMVERFKTDEEAKLIAEGRTDEVINRRTEAMRLDADTRVLAATTKVDETQGLLDSANATIVSMKVDASIERAAAKMECAPTALPDIQRAAREMFTMNAETGNIEARQDGVVMMGTDGKSPLDPAAWLGMQKTDSPHWWGPSAGGGAGGGTNVTGKGAANMTQYEKADGLGKLSLALSGGN